MEENSMKITADEAKKITENAIPKKEFKETKFYLFFRKQLDKVKLPCIYIKIKRAASRKENEILVKKLSNNLFKILENEKFHCYYDHFRHCYVIRW